MKLCSFGASLVLSGPVAVASWVSRCIGLQLPFCFRRVSCASDAHAFCIRLQEHRPNVVSTNVI